jgi:hypothetical protein
MSAATVDHRCVKTEDQAMAAGHTVDPARWQEAFEVLMSRIAGTASQRSRIRFYIRFGWSAGAIPTASGSRRYIRRNATQTRSHSGSYSDVITKVTARPLGPWKGLRSLPVAGGRDPHRDVSAQPVRRVTARAAGDRDEIDFAPVGHTTTCLALLSLEEAHDLLRLLVAVAGDGGPDGSGDRCPHPLGELTASPRWTTYLAAAPGSRVRP